MSKLEIKKLKAEKRYIEKELNNVSNFYITKVVVFKEWEENDQRALDLIAKRESLRKRHDEIKELLK